jgi:hypothetical protein
MKRDGHFREALPKGAERPSLFYFNFSSTAFATLSSAYCIFDESGRLPSLFGAPIIFNQLFSGRRNIEI